MKNRIRSALLVLCGLALLAGGTPAKAANSYTILASQVFIASGNAFVAAGCNPAYISSPANGIDSRVIDLGGTRPIDTTLSVQWTAVTQVAEHAGGGMTLLQYSSDCKQIPNANSGSGVQAGGGTWNFRLPANSRYLLISNNSMFNVTLTF